MRIIFLTRELEVIGIQRELQLQIVQEIIIALYQAFNLSITTYTRYIFI